MRNCVHHFWRSNKSVRWALRLGGSALAFAATARAASVEAVGQPSLQSLLANVTGTQIVTCISMLVAVASVSFAIRKSNRNTSESTVWSQRLAETEARYERSESILASHPGLVVVWDDAYADIQEGWGSPRVLGGPAALASLLTLASDEPVSIENPTDCLLSALGGLPLDDDDAKGRTPTLSEKVSDLRSHGVAFSGSVVTDEGRSIECDGRVAGDQVTLWLTDPAVRLADEAGVVGQARDKAADLHGALNQLDRAPMAAWRRGPDMDLEWVNKSYIEIVEAINLQEVIDEQIEIDPAFRELSKSAKKEFERSGRRFMDGVVKVSIKGQRRALRVVETPLHGAGDPSFGGIAIDVTRQQNAQSDLERQREAHRKTLDQLSAAVAVFNGAQQLEYYNQAFAELWDLDDSELRARPSHAEFLDRLRHLERLPAQDDFSAWKRSQLRLYTEEYGDAASVTEGEAPDEIWNLPSGKNIRVRQQRHALGGVSAVFEDITENLDLQGRYQTQINVQRETLNRLAEAVAVFRSDGRLALFNRSFESTWSLSREDLATLPHYNVIQDVLANRAEGADNAFEEVRRRILSFEADDRTALVNEEIALKDGRYLVCATTPLPDGATLLTFLDVTDSRERQHELEARNQILEDADRIKSRFVDHISYQLRNPLNTIIGFSEMLEAEMVGALNERQKDYASTVLMASNHLMDLVNDIIDLAAIDAGRLGLEMDDVDVGALLNSAASFAALKSEDSQVKLTVACADDVGHIRIDERRIKQVLFNLLANAFTFTEPGGEVILGARRDGDAVCLWVEDTGRGVSPEDQATVFNRFESAGPGAGAGLGLALVNSFVELHGGFVRLESRESEGTVVTCHLPVAGPLQASGMADESIESAVAALLDTTSREKSKAAQG